MSQATGYVTSGKKWRVATKSAQKVEQIRLRSSALLLECRINSKSHFFFRMPVIRLSLSTARRALGLCVALVVALVPLIALTDRSRRGGEYA